jgi:hypothetical protein
MTVISDSSLQNQAPQFWSGALMAGAKATGKSPYRRHWYVASTASGGSDSHDGTTPGRAWATLGKFASELRANRNLSVPKDTKPMPGDVCIVEPGHETLVTAADGLDLSDFDGAFVVPDMGDGVSGFHRKPAIVRIGGAAADACVLLTATSKFHSSYWRNFIFIAEDWLNTATPTALTQLFRTSATVQSEFPAFDKCIFTVKSGDVVPARIFTTISSAPAVTPAFSNCVISTKTPLVTETSQGLVVSSGLSIQNQSEGFNLSVNALAPATASHRTAGSHEMFVTNTGAGEYATAVSVWNRVDGTPGSVDHSMGYFGSDEAFIPATPGASLVADAYWTTDDNRQGAPAGVASKIFYPPMPRVTNAKRFSLVIATGGSASLELTSFCEWKAVAQGAYIEPGDPASAVSA